MPNLKRLNKEAFEELKRIDEAIENINSSTQVDQTGTQTQSASFYDIASKEWVLEYDENGNLTTNPVYNYFTQLERAQRSVSGIPQDEESMYTYVNREGHTTPLSVFRYTQPKNQDYIEDALLGEFSELDPKSEMINTDFDQNEDEELQPKHTEQFLNKNWQKIQEDPKLKAFYDEILKTMREAYSLLPNMNPDKM